MKKILDNFLISEDMEWISKIDAKPKSIESIKAVMKRYNVKEDIATEALDLSSQIMTLRSQVQITKNMNDIIKNKLISSGREDLLSEQKDLDIVEDKLISILGKEGQISSYEFSLRYLDILEEKRGLDLEFDNFLDFLQNNKDYGIVSTFCELSDPGEIGNIRKYFENEEITIELVNEFAIESKKMEENLSFNEM